MRRTGNYFILVFVLASSACFGQKADVVLNYIETYKELAITEMQRTGVPAAITLAQGIHESGAGSSKLVLASNNHFGIKCKSNWEGESVKHDDDEKKECFRKYPLAEHSYRDHSDFLKNGKRYAFLFELQPTDYVGWANGLKQAGYATNPKYPQVLIKLIESYNLQDYTMIALGKPVPKNEDIVHVSAYKDVEGSASKEIGYPIEKEVAVAKENYPEGEFKINDTKVIYAKKGTSFLAIAKQYDVDLSKIFDFNEMERTETLPEDQLIYIQRKRKTGKDEFHTVLPGETLHSIAQKQAIRLETLRELNWLKLDEKPAPGVQLSLRKKSSSIPKLVVKENYSLIQDRNKGTSN
ncbi:hypothetical protein CAP36_10390 [Chitinophagaceae bacterium IBVUCB2]|nr:hypothetical protein CAP36_10390 [Chitinophagaceae bacterium IBVUCB2]